MSESRATLTKRRAEVSAMFDGVAKRYDLLNSMLTFGGVEQWRRTVADELEPRPGMKILDLAAGTGTSTRPLADAGAFAVAADMSWGMLQTGKQRQPDLTFVAGDALHLPFADKVFDAVTISFGLRNVEDTVAALTEMRRVTKPGGQLLVCEFSTPTNGAIRWGYHSYLRTVMPLMSKVASNPAAYDYLAESIVDWPDQRRLAELMTEAGWKAVGWRNLTQGFVALHRGWAA
nr:demethylmenaquinone methyltransferase [Aestuariimicrobium ganziense]